MRWLLICALLLCGVCGHAEEALQLADAQPLHNFAREFAPGFDVSGMAEGVIRGDFDAHVLLDRALEQIREPISSVLICAADMLAPVVLLMILGCVLREAGAASFITRIYLLLSMCRVGVLAMDAARACLNMCVRFSDVIAPALSTFLTAMGMTGSAALVSPAAALTAGVTERLFLNCGLALCSAALCTSLAGSLSPSFDLNRLTKLMRKTVGWGTGLCFTVFTALIAIQGNVSASLDGVGMRTAKYAVDSAAPVIGSGVSDAWEAYVCGVMAAKSALGASGIVVLIAAGLKPVITALAAMVLLHLVSVLLDIAGEKTAGRAAEQVGSVCQMALELCTGALAITTILVGALMAAGGSLL